MMLESKINNDTTFKKLRKLSIQFSLGGFSFCIKNQDNETVYFEAICFDQPCDTPIQLLEKIEGVFASKTELQQDFETVFVLHQNELASFVPDEYFDENKLEAYLNHNVKVLRTDFITFDEVATLAAKNVYIPYININNYLFQHFGEFTYKHHLSVLLEKSISYTPTNATQVFVNVWHAHFDVLVIENGKLLFSNVFSYQTQQDFIYYLLFVYEQLKLDTETIPVLFSGAIGPDEDTYKISYQYIRHLSFIENKATYFKANPTATNHNNYLLID